MYYKPSECPSFRPLPLYCPGGYAKTHDPTNKLPGTVIKNGVTYYVRYPKPGDKRTINERLTLKKLKYHES